MIASILLVTTELEPLTPGGAGVLAGSLIRDLDRAGVRVRTLLVADVDVADSPDVEVVRIDPPASPAGFWARSKHVATVVARAVADEPPDLIEIQDFDAIGFDVLTRRHELGLESIPVAVRFHGPVDLQLEATGAVPPELEIVRVMERAVFSMADMVIVPTGGLSRLVVERYGVPAERVVVGPPSIDPLPAPNGDQPVDADAREIVVIGRLGEVKGSHDMIEAMLPVLEGHPDVRLRFIGGDGWSVTAQQSMRAWLTGMVPQDLRPRVLFDGPAPRAGLAGRIAGAWAVVVPSRFESFCLAAHEARLLGLPVVVPNLPAFAGLLDETHGALVYDGSVAGLREAITTILDDTSLRNRLASAPAPEVGDPLHPYEMPARPRHPQAQAGLATAAVNDAEAALPAPDSHRLAPLARSLLRSLPEPLARFAVRAVPRRFKDRFRSIASWPEEQARRQREAELQRVERLVADGHFAEMSDPEVSVVIPVYDDARFLRDALVSVYGSNTGRPSFEVIVVDDGSTDPSTIAALDALEWPSLRLIRQENRGLPAARNSGIRRARGRFIVPLDSDDMLDARYLETMSGALDDNPDAAFAHCWAVLFGDVDRVWQTRPYNPYQLLLSNSVVGCVMLRREVWEAAGGYDESMTRGNEDWELWVRLMAAGYEQTQVPMPLFHYRKHGTSMSVATEARFEAGRGEIVRRHPDLYAPDAMRALKAAHYPLVSVIVPPGQRLTQDLDDVQVVPLGDSLLEAVEQCRGKYVTVWDPIEAAPDALGALAAALERSPHTIGARPVNAAGPVMMRRWALHDPRAPLRGEVEVEVDAAGPAGTLEPGMAPRPLWMEVAHERTVQRQRPEESGYLPEWLVAR